MHCEYAHNFKDLHLNICPFGCGRFELCHDWIRFLQSMNETYHEYDSDRVLLQARRDLRSLLLIMLDELGDAPPPLGSTPSRR